MNEQQETREINIKLNWYQDKFLFSKERYSCLIGGVGTGKTFVFLLKAWQICQENPGSLGLIVRREYTDLRDSTINDFEKYFGVKVKEQAKEYEFPNGSKIMFRHGDLTDKNVLKNINLTFFGIEQAEEYETSIIFDFLRDRLRQSENSCGFLIANAAGHNWIYERFIEGAKSEVYDLPTGQVAYAKPNYFCATANSFANAHNLPASYVADLRAQEKDAPEHYKQYVINDFNVLDADDLLLTPEEISNLKQNFSGLAGKRYLAADLARFGKDKCVCFIGEEVSGFKFAEVATDAWGQKDTLHSVGRIADIGRQMNLQDGTVDCDGLGQGYFDNLKDLVNGHYGLKEFHNTALGKQSPYANVRTEIYFYIKELASKGWLYIKTPEIINDLARLSYTYNRNGQKMMISKEIMRSKGVKSPDYADALMMSVWLWKTKNPETSNLRRRKIGRFNFINNQMNNW